MMNHRTGAFEEWFGICIIWKLYKGMVYFVMTIDNVFLWIVFIDVQLKSNLLHWLNTFHRIITAENTRAKWGLTSVCKFVGCTQSSGHTHSIMGSYRRIKTQSSHALELSPLWIMQMSPQTWPSCTNMAKSTWKLRKSLPDSNVILHLVYLMTDVTSLDYRINCD